MRFLFAASPATTILLVFYLTYSAESFSLEGIKNKTTDIIKLGSKTGEGIVKKVPDLIPTPENIYNVGKQTLIGLPFELLLSALDKICSIALAADNSTEPYKQPSIQEMNYVLITENDNVSIPVTESGSLWKHPKFDAKKKVIILVTGWNSDINDTNTAAEVLSGAYKGRGDNNFILIDTARYVDTLYAWSAFNTQELGEGLGKGIADLINYVPIENIHLMGHSLGAHIAGAAGRTFQMETGQLLPRITGFDPAKPCFREGESLNGLARGDAEFVDIIHSNAGALGKQDPIGDADFYPNGIVSLMPGCLTIFCSHSRAWEYFAESVKPGNENNFIAKKCGSLHSYEINACLKDEVPMGYACPGKVKGNFFLKTNQEAPFGLKGVKTEDKNKEDKKEDKTEDKKDETKNDEKKEEKKEDKKPTEESTTTKDPEIDVRMGDLSQQLQTAEKEKPMASSGSGIKPFQQLREFTKSVSAKIF